MLEDDGHCYTHNFEMSQARCRSCGYEFCADCLVYAFGAGKPPFCIACALTAGGVRSNAARRPAASRRALKVQEKERKKAEKQAAKMQAPRVEIQPAEWQDPFAMGDDEFSWADDGDDSQRVPY